MEIIIAHGKTKRRIVGAFSICGSKADLESVGNQIVEHAKHYGWVDIYPEMPPVLADQEPVGWDD